MLEDQNYPIPNSDPFERDILPGVLGSEKNILSLEYLGSSDPTSYIYPNPANFANHHKDVLSQFPTYPNLTDSISWENTEIDILTGSPLGTSSIVLPEENFFNSGYFTVGESGEITIDFIYDGGRFRPVMAIYSLEKFPADALNNYPAYIKEAANRALSNSELGYVVISDRKEGANIKGGNNSGPYQGIETFNMNPGEKFGIMLVPNGEIKELLNNSKLPGNKRPLFSLATDNPEDNFWSGQIASFETESEIYTWEDLSINRKNTDRDYNDLIFKLSGATGTFPTLDEVINPEKDWRSQNLGNQLNE